MKKRLILTSFLQYKYCITSSILYYIILVVLVSGCSSFKSEDYAIRIKPEAQTKYEVEPSTGKSRSGSTLRGTIVKILRTAYPNDCPVSPSTNYTVRDTILFLDSIASPWSEYERIPVNDVVLMGQMTFKPTTWNRYQNINLYEYWYDPFKPNIIKEVPVDSTFKDTCCYDCYSCNCKPIDIPCLFCGIDCPDRVYSWYFLEMRLGYAIYDDFRAIDEKVGREKPFVEIAAGYRNGLWGIGLAFNYGISAYNTTTAEDVVRPIVMLHGRYRFSENKCFKPFLYGQLGLSVDKFSMDFFNFSCSDCQDKIDFPEVDLSIPINYGFGIGFDIPIMSFLDLSADAGFRSFAFSEPLNIGGYRNVPSTRRINMIVFRVGFTF